MLRIRKSSILFGLFLCLLFVILDLQLELHDSFNSIWLFGVSISKESALIACYDNNSFNTLESIRSEHVVKNSSIFFVETSCHPKELKLNPRQACAVESAAKLNPNSHVYLLVPSPVRGVSTEGHVEALFSYPNVRIQHIDMNSFFTGTPLEDWYEQGILKSSRWPRSHASDVLRYTTLWKYGGTYIDLDVVLLKSFNGLKNFAGAESPNDVAAGFLSLEHNHTLTHLAMDDLRYKFRGWDWGYNGPGVITRILKRYCGVNKVTEMTDDQCRGFKVLEPNAFYPIPWRQWKDYFVRTSAESDRVMAKINHSLAIHVWNHHSKAMNVTVGSKQPYSRVASLFCPRVFATLNEIF